ncbi:MAG: hypothetical protein HC862_23625 [Scytonema sp. RU_4_4]|nr:hypothetical protein [Scytonema sp. RU_4_4]NJR74231.1 hypothetical protein [Scytonema sp. CRU_2_7]
MLKKVRFGFLALFSTKNIDIISQQVHLYLRMTTPLHNKTPTTISVKQGMNGTGYR